MGIWGGGYFQTSHYSGPNPFALPPKNQTNGVQFLQQISLLLCSTAFPLFFLFKKYPQFFFGLPLTLIHAYPFPKVRKNSLIFTNQSACCLCVAQEEDAIYMFHTSMKLDTGFPSHEHLQRQTSLRPSISNCLYY